MKTNYAMISKRKSVRKFDSSLRVSEHELEAIRQQLQKIEPLDDSVRVAYRIVESGQTTCRRGEYCLLLYSTTTPRALLNAGYLLEQMDLFLASMDIGVCWHGIGKPDVQTHDGLHYIIMLAFGKSSPEDFRKDVTKAARKPREVIWQGDFPQAAIDAARYAPSACNMQPWRVILNGNELHVYRTTNVHSAIMPVRKRPYFNTIDLGIFLQFLEISLAHHGYAFRRVLVDETTAPAAEPHLIPIAVYTL